jgi:hypothetical protein
MIEYTYDSRSELRDVHRAEHRAYLAKLADRGDMRAYGRFEDDQTPGAMLIAVADDAHKVEDFVSHDPFVIAGLVPDHRVRHWVGTFADGDAD